jgi:Flp pilus assembly protein TadG
LEHLVILHRLLQQRRGGIAAITALMLPVLIGSAGMASDTIQLVFIKRVMQRQVDSGAIAGAFALSQGKAVAATVTTELARTTSFPYAVSPVIENAPTTGAYVGNNRAVRVVLVTDRDPPFLGMFIGTQRITVEATAAVVGLGEHCALALDTRDVTGVSAGGSTTMDFNCGIMANSISSSAVVAGGSSNVKASPIAAVGGVPASSSYAAGTERFPYSVPQADPFAGLPSLAIGSGNGSGNVNSNQTRSMSPGTYAGMDIKGTANLAAGIYYIDGGSLRINAQAVINGTNIVFVLTSRNAATNPSSIAVVDINGGATVNITSPSSGTYSGILFYQDRRALDRGDNKINGNSSSRLQGAIYFPNQEVQFNGNSSMNINCLKLVAKRLVFTGNSSITNTCPANSGVGSILGTKVKLVG